MKASHIVYLFSKQDTLFQPVLWDPDENVSLSALPQGEVQDGSVLPEANYYTNQLQKEGKPTDRNTT